MTQSHSDIYCCGCKKRVTAKLTNGSKLYPHRPDLNHVPFWECPICKNFVGCHHKTKDRTRPLGSIPTKELREKRKIIHSFLDPIWKSRTMTRKEIYHRLSDLLHREYHTAEINTIEDADLVIQFLVNFTERKHENIG